MNIDYATEDRQFAKVYHWLGIIVVCALSFPLHFIYEWSGENAIVGTFAPINESIWEHLNLVFWPLLLWWGIGYLVFQDRKDLVLNRWLPAGTISILISMIVVVSWYYVLQSGFAIETEFTNIVSLFIAVPIGQLVGIHVYRVIEQRLIYVILSLVILIAFAGMFMWFTFNTPDLPIFIPAG